jgi:hypothetical protein
MTLRRLSASVLLLAALGGTAAARAPEGGPQRPGVVVIVGGVGGWDPLPRSAELVFPLAGVPHRICDFVWTHGWGQMFTDLQDTSHLVAKARELASLILQFKTCEPERPVYLVAKSGGTGLALLAAEHLPPQTLERIVLISSAVSPGYDLRGALRATRGEVVSYYSRLDLLILWWGTKQYGTIDGRHEAAAGQVGFRRPADLDEEGEQAYRRLVEIHWNPLMLLQGYAGMHSLNSYPLFVAFRVVPWLR